MELLVAVSFLAAFFGYVWFDNKFLKDNEDNNQAEQRKDLEPKIYEEEKIAEAEKQALLRQEAEKNARIVALELEAAEAEKLRIKRERKEREKIEEEIKIEAEKKVLSRQQSEKEARIAAIKLETEEQEKLRVKREKKEKERIEKEKIAEAEKQALLRQEAEKNARIEIEAAKAEKFRIQREEKEREIIEQKKKTQADKAGISSIEAEASKDKKDDLSPTIPRGNALPKYPTLNSGIPELDGPGVYSKLTAYPKGHALYLFYSAQHKAYKVGIREPRLVASRLIEIRKVVPDVVVSGLAVFTSRQNAFDNEQKVLDRYKSKKYTGIKGRYVGVGEWISVRPTGKPYFPSPKSIEEKFMKDIQSPVEEIVVPDNYTVYLIYSKSKNSYLCSWCNSNNLQKKLEVAQKDFSDDCQIVSRIRVEERTKARAIAQANNKMSSSFSKEGRHEEYRWKVNPEYLYLFKKWDANGFPKKESDKSYF